MSNTTNVASEFLKRAAVAQKIRDEFDVSVRSCQFDCRYAVTEMLTEPEARAVASLLHRMRNANTKEAK